MENKTKTSVSDDVAERESKGLCWVSENGSVAVAVAVTSVGFGCSGVCSWSSLVTIDLIAKGARLHPTFTVHNGRERVTK